MLQMVICFIIFTSSNTRTDEYGGIENKARILFETLDALKDVIDYSKVECLNPSMHGTQE
jgi:N-ethylmaleimide reductase